MVTSINNPQVMGLGFRDANSVPQYNTPTGQTNPRQNAAANLGYERGNSSPLGLIPGMSFLKGPLGLDTNDTFGNTGTADSQGNVFAPNSSGINRAYDPITGRAVTGVAANLGSGIKTWSDSYGKLRGHGEGPIEAALGSYDNSIYKQMDDQRNEDGSTITAGEARTARMRGEGAPMNTIAGRISNNTKAASSPENFFMSETSMDTSMKPVSPYDIGFDGSRAGTPKSTTGVFGGNPGDIVPMARGTGFGVIGADSDTSITYDNEGNYKGGNISIMTPTGSVSSIRDSVTGEMIPTNTMSPLLAQEFERRAGEDNNPHHRIIEPDGGGPNGKIKSNTTRTRARTMNEFGDVITDGSKKGKYYNDTAKYGNTLLETRGADNDGDNSTDSNSGGK